MGARPMQRLIQDTIRRALADELTRLLGARDIANVSADPSVPTFRIKVSVQRFESVLGKQATIEAVWTVRDASSPPLTCSTRAQHAAAGDYEELVDAHQQALAELAKAIADGVKAAQGGHPSCPR